MKIILFAILLVVRSAPAQTADTNFVLDSSKPYVYLAFDHVGSRKPIEQGEDTQGMWLRIINNCKVPIAINTYKRDSAGSGVVVFDEVLRIGKGLTVHADYGEIPTVPADEEGLIGDQSGKQKPAQEEKGKQDSGSREETQPTMPHGYSAELLFVTRVLPGQSLLFSVPRDHVSPDWFMRIKFILDVSKPSLGPGPTTELDFFNEQVPVAKASLQKDIFPSNGVSVHEGSHSRDVSAP